MTRASPSKVRPLDVADTLLERGEHYATRERLAALMGCLPAQVAQKLVPAARAGRMLCVTKGGWAPVPVDRVDRGMPIAFYLDDMMKHRNLVYYVGYRTAASYHRVSHHCWAATQVVVPTYQRSRRIDGDILRFVRRSATAEVPTVRLPGWCDSPPVAVSTPEATVYDLVARPDRSGGAVAVESVLGNMLMNGVLSAQRLADTAGHTGLWRDSVLRRSGCLLAQLQKDLRWYIKMPLDLSPLRDVLAAGKNSGIVPLWGERRLPPPLGSPRFKPYVDHDWDVLVDGAPDHDLFNDY